MGRGGFQVAWWTGDKSVYALDIRVDSVDGRQGIGTKLYRHLLSRLQARQATCLLGWLRADAAPSRRFAERQGF